jgi:hypothetical protein
MSQCLKDVVGAEEGGVEGIKTNLPAIVYMVNICW